MRVKWYVFGIMSVSSKNIFVLSSPQHLLEEWVSCLFSHLATNGSIHLIFRLPGKDMLRDYNVFPLTGWKDSFIELGWGGGQSTRRPDVTWSLPSKPLTGRQLMWHSCHPKQLRCIFKYFVWQLRKKKKELNRQQPTDFFPTKTPSSQPVHPFRGRSKLRDDVPK